MTSWLGWGSSTEEDSSSGGELTAEEEESQKIHSTSELNLEERESSDITLIESNGGCIYNTHITQHQYLFKLIC